MPLPTAMTRIVKIPGRSAEARRARLQGVAAWMQAHGWRLADYAEEAGSALFERAPAAPALGWLDATRWLPGPGALRPREWARTLRADPRLALPPAFVLAGAVLLGLALFGTPSLDLAHVRREPAAHWYVVTAAQLNVREGPEENRQIVDVLYRDQRVLVEGRVEGDWARISVPARGYVAKAYLAPVQEPPSGDGTAEAN
jgi:Bacterial SH3 domain